MKYVLNTLLNTVLWVLIAVLLFFVASGFVQRYFGNRNIGLFGMGYAVVVSGSMEPNLRVNDLILYQASEQEEYRVGDIIVYTAERAEGTILITHRIVAIDGDQLITLGDNNKGVQDAPISFKEVIGRVVFRIPGVGVAVNFLRTTRGLIIAGAAFLILILLTVLLQLSAKRKEEAKA